MIFTVQSYLEDNFSRRGFVDSDGYAVRLANLYFHERFTLDLPLFLKKIHRINTTIFVNNGIENRAKFEEDLVNQLDRRFKKKEKDERIFPGGIQNEREKIIRSQRISIELLLREFCSAIEARAVDSFWEARKKGKLAHYPEKIGQGLFALFIEGTLQNRSGILLKEFQSGVGFVDFGLILSSTLHLIELKVITDEFIGVNQLEQYMKTERRNKGSLLVFDSGLSKGKIDFPTQIETSTGEIKVYRANINPKPPSSLN